MTLPITINPSFFVDLRQVPFIVGALYGGRKVALFLLLTLLVYRFYLALSGFEAVVIVFLLLFFLLCYVIPKFIKTRSIKKKLYLAALVSHFGLLCKMINGFLFVERDFTSDFLVFLISSNIIETIGIMFFIFLIEKSRKDAILAKEINKFERLKTVSTLAASISHEIRNPLTVTKGFLQLVREPSLAEREKEEYINIALEALDQVESTITDYLTFAKPSVEDVKILDLRKELIHIKKFIEFYAERNNVKIEMSLEENIHIAGEDKKLHQCLINVMKNGIEAMPQGGRLHIELKHIKDKDIIVITDTGIGMDKDQIERLGNPFFTIKDIGTGLGTMVVYSIVKAMHGEIDVDSEPGKGTSFAIFLPVVEHFQPPFKKLRKKSSLPAFSKNH